MSRVSERLIEVDGVRVFLRRTPGDGPPVVFWHGNPTSSEDWLPFLERVPGPAIAVDLPGWGASESPKASEFDYTMDGLARFCGRCMETLGVEEYSLVVHDWGVVALIAAQEHPERVRKVIVINAVPLLPGYRWHFLARYFWRVPGLGEVANVAGKPALRLLGRRAAAGEGPTELIETIRRHWGRGVWRPVLTLYRSADPDRLAAAGARLGALACPVLVVWGRRDPYLPPQWGRAYAERLPNAELVEIEDGGHWPWLERPDVVDRAVEFLEDG